MEQKPATMVILGATGDLTRRLLFPAIYRLYAQREWTPAHIIGYAVEAWSREQFCDHIEGNLKTFVKEFQPHVWQKLREQIDYQPGDLTAGKLAALKSKIAGPALFYLGLPPQLFSQAAGGLGQAGLNQESAGWRRLVVEKPFGWDLASARELGKGLHQWWREDQIFRIDHFLGKDTAQNILVFRFINRLLESVWNGAHIAQVQITFAETLGLEGRWQYYDRAGALRDMLQNHLLQLFALVAMEPPSEWDAEDLHNHKAEVLRAVRQMPDDQVFQFAAAGQYGKGQVGSQPVPGYQQEEGISAHSTTETFAAVKLYVDNWRWHGVPFYLRSGKRLAADYAEIAVQLKPVPPKLFGHGLADWLVFRMKPEEAIDLMMWAKKPGLELNTESIVLSAPYKRTGGNEYSAYEQLLLEVLKGDQSIFPRLDEVEEAWRVVDPILKAWSQQPPEDYAAGSEGPAGQDRILEAGQRWRHLGS